MKKLIDYCPSSEADKIENFIIKHFNRIYCVKSHLFERLEEIRYQPEFKGTDPFIKFSLKNCETQLQTINEFFQACERVPSFEFCEDLIRELESAFNDIGKEENNSGFRNLLLVNYLSHIEQVEKTSFKIIDIGIKDINAKQFNSFLTKHFCWSANGFERLMASLY